MKNRDQHKSRSDRPSGRQASELPEHGGGSGPATESLHQGQGPDFLTQNRRMQERNKGVQQLDKDNPESRGQRGPHQQNTSKTKNNLALDNNDDVPGWNFEGE